MPLFSFFHHWFVMSLLQLLRGLCTLLIAFPLTLLVSALAMVDLKWIRRSELKAQEWPRFWGRVLCRLAGVRVRVEGLEHLEPGQTYVFAGNHSSQYDIFAFQGYFPYDFRWLAKKELFRIPLFGRAMHMIGYIAIDRGHGRQALKSLDAAARRIAMGNSVLVFPEGTRSADGRVQPFKAGAVLLALKAQTPLVPLGFNGTHEVLPRGAWIPRGGEIVIRIGEPVPTTQYTGAHKQELAARLQSAVEALLEPRYVSS
ncbi:MAG: lysophospholipid acyltransferase family protein [Desulfobulbus sp.]|jgi:1-acyl-sn-glycerol-3-phosphate acyltransferase